MEVSAGARRHPALLDSRRVVSHLENHGSTTFPWGVSTNTAKSGELGTTGLRSFFFLAPGVFENGKGLRKVLTNTEHGVCGTIWSGGGAFLKY